MSAAHDAHGAHAAGHHASHDHDHFDNDPVQELPADEPRTPTWIPIVGLCLFFFAGTAWLLMGSDDAATAKADAAPAQVAPPVAPQPEAQAQPARVPPAMPQARPAPAPLGSGGLRQLTPDQAKQIQQQIEALRARQQQGGAPQPAPAPAPVPR